MDVLDQSIEKSPFFPATERHGAKAYIVLNHMFMPYRYGDPVEEYWALVNDATLWDVAAERQVEIAGPDASAFVDLIIPRNLNKCGVGQCRYVVVTDERGAIINDPVLNRLEENRYWLSAADSDLILWVKGVAAFAGMNVFVHEPNVAPIQIQGGKSRDILCALFGDWVRQLGYYRLIETELDGIPVILARTGWSGDLGYEIYLRDTSRALELWDRVVEAGKPFNLRVTGPNTIRRVEAGIIAMRSDFPADATPYHLGMERLVDLEKPAEFVGKAALRRIAEEGVSWKLIGVAFEPGAVDAGAAAYGRQNVRHNGDVVGTTTVTVFSPRLNQSIGYARVDSRCSQTGMLLEIDGPNGPARARVAERPFLDPHKWMAGQQAEEQAKRARM